MAVVVGDARIEIRDVVSVARQGARVSLAPDARDRMDASHAVVLDWISRGEPVYGATTGVGVLKREHAPDAVGPDLLDRHDLAQGPATEHDTVRAAAFCLLTTLCLGHSGVRGAVGEELSLLLNEDRLPEVRSFGSIGIADLTPLAALGRSIFERFDPAPSEALAVIDNNAYSVGASTLAIHDARMLANAMEVTGAVALEGFAASLAPLDEATVSARPYPGLIKSAARVRALLQGGVVATARAARDLQDPLTFRDLAHVCGALRDALTFAETQVTIELNSHQGNPFVDVGRGTVHPSANFDALPLAHALDTVRIALASAVTSTQERILKLLDSAWSGLPTGLTPTAEGDSGLTILGIVAQSIAAEARLLAQPVSFELTSTTHAEGIEDRMTSAPLAARRLAEMVVLGERLAAMELVVAAQAIDLRASGPLGKGTGQAHRAVRGLVPFMASGDPVPRDFEAVRALLRSPLFVAEET
jgi:histidine ammonia-lyase